MATSPPKSVALAIAPKFSAFLSICGSSAIIFMVLSIHKRRNHIRHRIMLCLSISDILASIFFFASTWPIPKGTPSWFGDGTQPIYGAIGNEHSCNAAGFFNQFQVANPLFSASLATYYFLSVNCNWKQSRLKRIEWRFYVIPYLYATITSVFAVAANLIGHVEWTCWILPPGVFQDGAELTPIQSRFKVIQWLFLFGPVWVCVIFISVLFFKLYRKMRALEDKMKSYSHRSFKWRRTISNEFQDTRNNTNTQGEDEDDVVTTTLSGTRTAITNNQNLKLEVSTIDEESGNSTRDNPSLRRRVTFADEQSKKQIDNERKDDNSSKIDMLVEMVSNASVNCGDQSRNKDLPLKSSENEENAKTGNTKTGLVRARTAEFNSPRKIGTARLEALASGDGLAGPPAPLDLTANEAWLLAKELPSRLEALAGGDGLAGLPAPFDPTAYEDGGGDDSNHGDFLRFLQASDDHVEHEEMNINEEDSGLSPLNKPGMTRLVTLDKNFTEQQIDKEEDDIIVGKHELLGINPTPKDAFNVFAKDGDQSRKDPHLKSSAGKDESDTAIDQALTTEPNNDKDVSEKGDKKRSLPSLSSLNRRRGQWFVEAKKSKEIAIQGMLYVLVFYITWLFPTISRITDLAGVKVYAIQFLDTFFLPLQGLLNFLIYIRPMLHDKRRKNPDVNLLMLFRSTITNDNVR